MSGICENCGGPCRYSIGGRLVRFCNLPDCVRAGNRARSRDSFVPAPLVVGRCEVCAVEFLGRSGKRYCSQNCCTNASKAKSRAAGVKPYKLDQKNCQLCGSRYLGKRESAYCSKRCVVIVNNRKRAKGTELVLYTGPRKPAPPVPVTVIRGGWWCAGNCVECGQPFVSSATVKTCSDPCRESFYKRKRAHMPLRHSVRKAVYARDGMVCQICFEPTDPTASPISDWYPSLDHIIPRSKGGGHTVDNLRVAHRWCNSVRSDERYYQDSDLRV